MATKERVYPDMTKLLQAVQSPRQLGVRLFNTGWRQLCELIVGNPSLCRCIGVSGGGSYRIYEMHRDICVAPVD